MGRERRGAVSGESTELIDEAVERENRPGSGRFSRVGPSGLEPLASCVSSKRSTRLS